MQPYHSSRKPVAFRSLSAVWRVARSPATEPLPINDRFRQSRRSAVAQKLPLHRDRATRSKLLRLMTTLPTIAWIWTIGVITVLGVLFCGVILWTRRRGLLASHRRIAVIALWIVAASIGCHLLFLLADAKAAVGHHQNVFIPIICFYFWILAVAPAPLFGFALSRLFNDDARNGS